MKDLDLGMVKVAQEKSCNKEESEVFGGKYVSKDPDKQDRIMCARKKILQVALGVVATFVIGGTVKIASDISFADDVREEVNAKKIFVDNIGGMTEDLVLIHDEGFVAYINEMSDSELSSLYSETSKQMQEEGLGERTINMTSVVAEMEENYLEELKPSVTK